ncbi:uncharacterized membrane-anchored protein YjiN (DUF445 family) [Sphingomonas vulcanisoli]|uniref:Uncharacterized membrane-anchored protein YjiN (DUF445 family) n=1 Tax=Sphingomonas vulcanisoli TaxID=1658060 RepID=A0ABX0TWR9_9SPHN|nr:DUF445 domain-containing protein [Sphingomonas vulcanisoli]NIJ08835.1 uncharacterized membrane-anchored protein YjiN (DUF445 family) [Sphingomonas vulcanisoli]
MPSPAPLPARPHDRRGTVRGMRIIATGLLLVMAAVYLAARLLEHRHSGWGYLRAFAEAAMVGGLADWFAVTALFRHPLGLPIPHTAIIPRNKDRIGDSLAAFLRSNFLVPQIVARRMGRIDLAAGLGRLLARPPLEGRKRSGKLVAALLEGAADERLANMVKSAAVRQIGAVEIGPLLGQLLDAAIAEQRHRPVIDGAIDWIGRTLDANQGMFRKMISERAGSILRWTGLDETVATKVLEGLFKMLADVADDPHHPLRDKAEEGLARLAWRLQHDPEMQARVARFRDSALENPALGAWLDGLWESARGALLNAVHDPDEVMAGRLGEALRNFGDTLQRDESLRRSINRFARRAVASIAVNYGDAIVSLVSETVRRWDTGTVTSRLENAVGRDLQYIRVNGTLVGGLVGLAIHAFDVLA